MSDRSGQTAVITGGGRLAAYEGKGGREHRQHFFLDGDGVEEDIVQAMLFLSSPRARFITGEILRVTGDMAAGVRAYWIAGACTFLPYQPLPGHSGFV